MVMLVYLNSATIEGASKDQLNSKQDIIDAIIECAVMRVCPKAMTVSVIIAGLIPIMLGSGSSSDVMQRIAAPIGGMITAPILSLFVIRQYILCGKVES